VEIPTFPVDVDGHAAESSAFFDELIRTGRFKQLTNPTRANTWVNCRTVPAVEYLQQQRARMMMMMELAKATSHLDVYLAAPAGGGGGARGGGARGGGAPANPPAPQSATQRHSTMANLACTPALSVHNGFNENGTPTSVTFFAPPFKETEILALAKAYQDAAGFHLKHPTLA
jgi:Asp-tRNA(Asn)/Glu-tRNA(Gln) amidotransferase A subunit family amidase